MLGFVALGLSIERTPKSRVRVLGTVAGMAVFALLACTLKEQRRITAMQEAERKTVWPRILQMEEHLQELHLLFRAYPLPSNAGREE